MNFAKLHKHSAVCGLKPERVVEYLVYYSLLFVWSVSCMELQTQNPLRHLPLGGTESLLPFKSFVRSKGNNLTEFALAHRSSRVKRDNMFYFPSGSSLTFRFGLVTPVYSDTSISITSDLRLEVKFKLPNRPSSRRRRRRSITDDRAALYMTVMELVDKSGLDGRECLQRAVCEAAQAPLLEYGLLGEVLDIVLTPGHDGSSVSTAARQSQAGNETVSKFYSNITSAQPSEHNSISSSQWQKPLRWRRNSFGNFQHRSGNRNDVNNSTYNGSRKEAFTDLPPNYVDMSDFVEAEEYGRYEGNCWVAFPNCAVSIREVLFDALSTLSKNNHLLVHDEL
ncbi:Protein of unknown function DM4/12 [Trinorchestia longiramus]|nr:Protein of unknown function DM4/12 [Trinorchestia longiramus]